ncbi:hypothetical protein LE190_11150 [Massilia oculi]|uniref:Uncharacterized protein n=1 Tax=Massilia hydrophila TaxID=3044279 RepID=A0ABS7Y9U3_9BURK|nr:hypothetical protein [Massilia oculi]MCA1856472.1 hypothetical protein [Massilia oculi]
MDPLPTIVLPLPVVLALVCLLCVMLVLGALALSPRLPASWTGPVDPHGADQTEAEFVP